MKRRAFNDHGGMLSKLADVHCFELSGVIEAVDILAQSMLKDGECCADTSFLPAPNTWIEFTLDGMRCGWLLQECKKQNRCEVVTCFQALPESFASNPAGILYFGTTKQPEYSEKAALGNTYTLVLAALAVINTPRVIGRKQHMPHRGLERRLSAALGIQGRFPLHAWTEIKLRISDPEDLGGTGSSEAHYTGQRALHFCRSHLRVRFGRVEIVRAHWRGDASLGIKRSRYKLEA